MSRFSGRLRAVLISTALLLAAGCGGVGQVGPDEAPDLFQALPPPSPPPTAVPTTPPPSEKSSKTRGASSNDGDGGSAGRSGIDWDPVYTFDFNGSQLDTSVWNPYYSEGGFGNGYRRPSAITVEDGKLVITARGDISGGMGHRYDQRYGRWEFRARTERGRGYSSAILLWPESESKELDGELDMMEVPREQRDVAHFVVHWGKENNIHGGKVHADFTQWHTFALEWLPDRITWYVDGVKQYENRDKVVIPRNPMHLTIQLDQGPLKDWLPAVDETTPPEVRLEIDWVKIYKMPKDYE
jgi:beta-glucanase (GH16 family)